MVRSYRLPKFVVAILLMMPAAALAIPPIPECLARIAARPQTGAIEIRIQWADYTGVTSYYLYYQGELRVVALRDEHGTERCLPAAEWLYGR